MVTLLVFLLVGYLALCLLAFALQKKLVYFPGPPPQLTPEVYGLEYRPVELVTSDGLRLNAWFLPRAEASGAVLFHHGNAGTIADRLGSARAFLDQGLSVLLFDYRGYGASEGQPGEEGTYLDAEAAFDWLVGEGGVPAERVALYGESLGGAVAVELARRRPAACLFLESSFTSLPDVGARAYPILPVRLLATIRYDSRAKLPELDLPILVAHSPEDELVPFEFGRALFEAAGGPKAFLETSGRHNDGGFLQRTEWRDEVGAFLRSALAASDPDRD